MKYLIWGMLILLVGCTGNRPSNLGIDQGKLGPCPETPNCVSSFSTTSEHQIAPLSGSLEAVKQVLSKTERVAIITENDTYLYAEFTSFFWRFVDDVEFYAIPEQQIVHVRSASRLGKSDLGVNRDRIETIRAALAN